MTIESQNAEEPETNYIGLLLATSIGIYRPSLCLVPLTNKPLEYNVGRPLASTNPSEECWEIVSEPYSSFPILLQPNHLQPPPVILYVH